MVSEEVRQAWLRKMPLVLDPEYQALAPVTYPVDMHPLPNDIEAYCVYTFRAEDLVRTSPHLSSQRWRAVRERHAQVLAERKQKRALDAQERLQKLAPGWAHGHQLEPTRPIADTTDLSSSLATLHT